MITPSENFSGKTGTPIFYTIPEFEEKVVVGELLDQDGVGYYATEEKISSVKTVLSEIRHDHDYPLEYDPVTKQPKEVRLRTRMADATHVAWFPKGG